MLRNLDINQKKKKKSPLYIYIYPLVGVYVSQASADRDTDLPIDRSINLRVTRSHGCVYSVDLYIYSCVTYSAKKDIVAIINIYTRGLELELYTYARYV